MFNSNDLKTVLTCLTTLGFAQQDKIEEDKHQSKLELLSFILDGKNDGVVLDSEITFTNRKYAETLLGVKAATEVTLMAHSEGKIVVNIKQEAEWDNYRKTYSLVKTVIQRIENEVMERMPIKRQTMTTMFDSKDLTKVLRFLTAQKFTSCDFNEQKHQLLNRILDGEESGTHNKAVIFTNKANFESAHSAMKATVAVTINADWKGRLICSAGSITSKSIPKKTFLRATLAIKHIEKAIEKQSKTNITNMNVLALSDIHQRQHTVDYIERLIEETKKFQFDFDCIIVGGDIGDMNETYSYSVLTKLSTLGVPVYYVWGNSDPNCSYTPKLPSNCFHLHHNIQKIGEYWLVGYSGCWFDWGKNPLSRETTDKIRDINDKYSDILPKARELDLCNSSIIDERKATINKKYDTLFLLLQNRGENKRLRAYKNREKRLKLRLSQHLAVTDSFVLPKLLAIRESDYYRMYKEEHSNACVNLTDKNINALVELIMTAQMPLDKLIIVTHERIDKLGEYFPSPPYLHLFGHRHGFRKSYYKGSNFVNISAFHPHCNHSGYDSPPTYSLLSLGGKRINANCVELGNFITLDEKAETELKMKELYDWRDKRHPAKNKY
ncbi:MAG: hypothetical protein ACI88H_000692 [Cocleimonas sp.]|jgi:hypothetical protein